VGGGRGERNSANVILSKQKIRITSPGLAVVRTKINCYPLITSVFHFLLCFCECGGSVGSVVVVVVVVVVMWSGGPRLQGGLRAPSNWSGTPESTSDTLCFRDDGTDSSRETHKQI